MESIEEATATVEKHKQTPKSVSQRDQAQTRRLANQALQDVFTTLGGDCWRNKDGWLTPGSDVRKWHGLTIESGTLISLNLINNDLEGEIPPGISDLVTLKEVNMSYNFGIKGSLPTNLGNMTNLRILHMYSASLTGTIPDSLSWLCNLEELWLNGNQLTGYIPRGLGHLSQLRELFLNSNELLGTIPQSFSGLTNLEGLNLGWNLLEGGFPSYLGNMVNLKLLVLDGNEQLCDLPPATHGKDMTEWLMAKRASLVGVLERRLAAAETARLNERDKLAPRLSAALTRNQYLEERLSRSGIKFEADEVQEPTQGMAQLAFTLESDKISPRNPNHRADSSSDLAQNYCGGLSAEQQRVIVADYLGTITPPNLQEVMQDKGGAPYSLAAFREFAMAQLLEENLDFWVEVERLRRCNDSDLPGLAVQLCDRFIKPGSQMEVNVSSSVRKDTLAKIDQLLKETQLLKHVKMSPEHREEYHEAFNQAQRQIYDLIETDAFPRFMHSIAATLQSFTDGKTTGLTPNELEVVKDFVVRSRKVNHARVKRITPSSRGHEK
ncbi:unnamed protein product [Discosporangium mesarthrocarpum]